MHKEICSVVLGCRPKAWLSIWWPSVLTSKLSCQNLHWPARLAESAQHRWTSAQGLQDRNCTVASGIAARCQLAGLNMQTLLSLCMMYTGRATAYSCSFSCQHVAPALSSRQQKRGLKSSDLPAGQHRAEGSSAPCFECYSPAIWRRMTPAL